jgi:hypothetical protein
MQGRVRLPYPAKKGWGGLPRCVLIPSGYKYIHSMMMCVGVGGDVEWTVLLCNKV